MMMVTRGVVAPVAAVLLLSACATIPTGPTVMVLPGNGKSFEQFQGDDVICRQWALQQTGTTTGSASTDSAVSGAVVPVGSSCAASRDASTTTTPAGCSARRHSTASGWDATSAAVGTDALGAPGLTRRRGDSRRRVPSADSAAAQDPPRACVVGAPCTPARSGPVRCGSGPRRHAAVAGG